MTLQLIGIDRKVTELPDNGDNDLESINKSDLEDNTNSLQIPAGTNTADAIKNNKIIPNLIINYVFISI